MFSIVHHFVSAHGFYMVFALVALQGFGFFFLPAETALMAAPINAAAILVWVCA